MKSWIIAGSCFSGLLIAGVFVAVFTKPVEYDYGEATAYIDGATPPHIEHWEMY